MRLIKYRFIQMLRDYSSMFWSLLWPLILGTMFFIAFGNMGNDAAGDGNWEKIPVAYIAKDTSTGAATFESFLEGMDNDLLLLKEYKNEKEALKALDNEKILGIFYGEETPTLTVSKTGVNESILSSVIETYNQNAYLVRDVASRDQSAIPAMMESLQHYETFTKNVSLGGASLDPMLQYFFALIAYACLSGAFLGVQASFDSQANLSPLGARRSVTPTHKLSLVMIDFFVLFAIQFVSLLILTFYLTQVLKISLGNNLPGLLGVELMGSIIGVSIGIAIGTLSKASLGAKMGITVAFTLVPSFFAGLMFGNMKVIIENSVPILNRINPAAVLSDAFYCLGVFQDQARYTRSIIILAVMSTLCLLVAFLGLRRGRYDSI